MIAQQITSLQHPHVKRLVKLKNDRDTRLSEKRVVIIGETLIREISQTHPLLTLISVHPIPISAEKKYLGTPEVLKKIINLTTDDLVVAEVSLPEPNSLKECQTLIILDSLGDPGNVGTILRTALGLGWEGAFLTENTADPFNDKAVRASRGASLLLPLRQGSWEELIQLLNIKKITLFIADLQGKSLSQGSFKTPLALLMGHETKGPSSIAKMHGKPISIPMHPKMESLNVASAAAIFMYEIKQKITP